MKHDAKEEIVVRVVNKDGKESNKSEGFDGVSVSILDMKDKIVENLQKGPDNPGLVLDVIHVTHNDVPSYFLVTGGTGDALLTPLKVTKEEEGGVVVLQRDGKAKPFSELAQDMDKIVEAKVKAKIAGKKAPLRKRIS